MTKKGESEGNLAPFLAKCYEMVDDDTTNEIISWSDSNDSFIVWNITQFTRDLLPKFFKHCNFSSFMRQLNIYGFRKTDTDRWEFTNEKFIKGEKHLLKSIKRRKNVQGSIQKNSQPGQPIEFSDKVDHFSLLEKEVEILKNDKIALMQELSKLTERQESSQNKLLLLRDRLQGMENNQQQLLSFLVMVMQSPGLLVQLLQPIKENSWRVTKPGKFTLEQETACEDSLIPDGSIVRYQPLTSEEPSTLPSFTASERNIGHGFSFNGVEDFLMNFNSQSPLFDENCSSNLPELDLEQLEQYLLSSPSRDGDEPYIEDEHIKVSEMEMEMEMERILFSTQPKVYGEGINQPVSVEMLTEKMGCLSPGRKMVENSDHP